MNLICIGSVLMLWQTGLDSWVSYIIKLVGAALFTVGISELRELCLVQELEISEDVEPPYPMNGIGDIRKLDYVGAACEESKKKGDTYFPRIRRALASMIGRGSKLAALLCGVGAAGFGALTLLKADMHSLPVNAAAVVLGLLASAGCLRSVKGAVDLILLNEKTQTFDRDESGASSKNRKLRFCDDISNITRLRSAFIRVSVSTGAAVAFDILNRVSIFGAAQTFFGFMQVISKIALIVMLISFGLSFDKVRQDCNRKQG